MAVFPDKCELCGKVIPEESPLGLCPHCVFSEHGGKVADVIPGIELGRRLGEGGFGEVYEGFQLGMPMGRVAVKIAREGTFSQRVVERFQVEMQILALMDHPGITRYLDSGKTSCGRLYYSMEHVEGRDLGIWARECKRTHGEILGMMERLCEAVVHAHQRGVMHRDLKAENVLVGKTGDVPKIIDFGIARVLSGPLELAAGVSVEGWVGSPHSMSPEQLEGDPRLDVRVDVYALGLLFYEISLREKVLAEAVGGDRSWAENAARVRNFRFPRLADAGLPREWDWVGARACAAERGGKIRQRAGAAGGYQGATRRGDRHGRQEAVRVLFCKGGAPSLGGRFPGGDGIRIAGDHRLERREGGHQGRRGQGQGRGIPGRNEGG